jgi:hypothetical protein
METLYQILEVDPKAKPDDIKRAYFLMAKRYHPDSGDAAEVSQFYKVSEAYQILSDTKERKAYDQTLKDGKLGEALVEEVIQPGSAACQQSMDDPQYAFRQKQQHRYRRGLFVKAVLRVMVLSFIMAVLGLGLSVILEGHLPLGIVAGMVFGFFLSVGQNFDLKTFIPHASQRRFAVWGSRVLIFLSAGYFAGLFLWGLQL